MGLVEKIIAIPSEFEAVSMHDGLSILLMQKAKSFRETQKETKKLLRKFKHNEEKTEQEQESQFILIPKKQVLIKRIRNELESAQFSIDLIANAKIFLQANQYCFKAYAKALERDAKIRAIIEKPTDKEDFPKTVQALLEKPNFKMRYIRAAPKANVVIFDKKEALVTVYPAASLTESPALWTNNPSFIAMYQEYFKNNWYSAIELKTNVAKDLIGKIDLLQNGGIKTEKYTEKIGRSLALQHAQP